MFGKAAMAEGDCDCVPVCGEAAPKSRLLDPFGAWMTVDAMANERQAFF